MFTFRISKHAHSRGRLVFPVGYQPGETVGSEIFEEPLEVVMVETTVVQDVFVWVFVFEGVLHKLVLGSFDHD